MRILHIVPSMARDYGGPPKVVLPMCKAALAEGHHAEVWTTSWPEPETAKTDKIRSESGVNIREFPWKRLISGFSAVSSAHLTRKLRGDHAQFDLVHVHGLWNPVSTFSMAILRKEDRPYVLTSHGMLDPVVLSRGAWKKILWAWLWERANVGGASAVHFSFAAESEKAIRSNWVKTQVLVAPNPFESSGWTHLEGSEEFLRLFKIAHNRELVLFVGRLNWVKNLDGLVRAFARLHERRPAALLALVGPDEDGERARLEALSRRLGVIDHVLFTGPLQGSVLRSAYVASRVFALVSHRENYGIALAEALASGLPAVVSDQVDSGPDFESTGRIRRVKGNPELIAEALLELLRNPKQGMTREEILKRLDDMNAKAATSLLKCYEDVLARRHVGEVTRL